jgi:hypothetical protein
MRTFITETTVYSFDGLSEKSQQKALEKLWDINVDYGWWDFIYEDAARIGLDINEFDIDRHIICGDLKEDLLDCCKFMRQQHGKECKTFKTAEQYLKEYIDAFKQWLRLQDKEDFEDWKIVDWLKEFGYSDEAAEITSDFRKALLEDYLIILRNEYDYLTSEEAIKEAIYANEYEFTADGELS